MLGDMPPPERIPATLNHLPHTSTTPNQLAAPPPLISIAPQSASLTNLLGTSSARQQGALDTSAPTPTQHMVGHGLPPIPKKLADRIIAGEYIDLAELPPSSEGQGAGTPFT